MPLLACALAACGVPAPDTTGHIECGRSASGDALCPNSFECRWGRCCPVGSPAGMCPAPGLLPVDRTGTGYEPAPGDVCPAGYEAVSGHCCLPGAEGDACRTSPTGRVCSPATGASDGTCGPAVTPEGMSACLGEAANPTGERFADGYCSRTCRDTSGDACGALGVCVDLTGSSGIGYCFAQCTLGLGDENPCRIDHVAATRYVCVRPANAPATLPAGRGLCVPRCATNTDCGSGRTCDGATHSCR